MGGIAAVFSKSPIDAPRVVAKMLSAMRHRGKDATAVAGGGTLESASFPASLAVSSSKRRTAVGYCFTKTLPSDIPQPVRAGEAWFSMDGRIVANGQLVGGGQAARILESRLTPMKFSSIRRDIDGAYALCCCTDEWLLVTRDQLGLKPVYFGRQGDLIAVASDRKALWTIGIADTKVFPVGGFLEATEAGSTVDSPIPETKVAKTTPDTSVDHHQLLGLLTESVSIQTAGLGAVAIGFSGGLDSTVLARIAKNAGLDLLLVTVGVGRTVEMSLAESTARTLGLPIVVKEFSKKDVAECLDHVLWLTEEPNLMKVSIAMAIRWIAQIASGNGRSIVILGQGSDELFGGYKRFATILGERGEAAASQAISESIRDAHEVNYQRDEQAVSGLRVELRLPFATRKITEFASKVPLNMKVREPSDNLRKWVLRDAAIKLGIPSEIALRPKKAIQHASGVEKAIREIAKHNQLPPSTYLEQRLRAMRRDFTDRESARA